MSQRRAIVNLITNSGYAKGQARLIESIKQFNPEIDLLTFTSETEVGAPLHKDDPYAFKLFAIGKARGLGYDQILWLDASVYAVKDITPVFNWLTEKGIFLESAGHYAGSWSPDNVLDYFGITRIQAMDMPMFSAGFIGLDFTNYISRSFFVDWSAAMDKGIFRGSWQNHRHDMTCGSIIANKQGLLPLYSPGGQFFSYVGPGYGEPSETACFHLQGL